MRRALTLLIVTILGGACPCAQAQGPPLPQVVQLPTFQSFSVSTSVLVPDQGTTVLGGVTSDAWASQWRGTPGLSRLPGAGRLLANRASGRATTMSTATVHAQIHDLAGLDAALLESDRAGRRPEGVNASADSAKARKAEFLTRNVARNRPDESRSPAPTASITEIRRELDLKQQQQESEAQSLIAEGDAAIESGRPKMAKIFYEMALRRTTGSTRTAAQTRLAELKLR